MADKTDEQSLTEYLMTKAEALAVIDAALGRDGEAPSPELWATLNPGDKTQSSARARALMDAAASRRREANQRRVMAESLKGELMKDVHAASARIAEYEKVIAAIEHNLVRPLCEGFGEGKTHEFDTGIARVALWKKTPSVVMTEEASKCPEDVVAMLPAKLLRIAPPEPDKTAIAKALKAGEEVPGFMLKTDGLRVEWRS